MYACKNDMSDTQTLSCKQIPDYPERRRGRKPKVDPAFLDVDKLTGEENVSVVNRLTGKKVINVPYLFMQVEFKDYLSFRLNRLPNTIYWKSPISILGMSGYLHTHMHPPSHTHTTVSR